METKSSPMYNREPCPDRIVDDLGAGFAMGLIGGSVFHFAKGVLSSPNGHRLSGGIEVVRMNALRTGGRLAAFGGLFSASDCAMVYLRQKEDPWNSILACATTSGILSLRQGLVPVAKHGLVGAAFMALIEGLVIMQNKAQPKQVLIMEDPNLMPPAPDTVGLPDGTMRSGQQTPVNETQISNSEESVFGRWREKLGLKKEQKKDDSAETKVLESFVDSPTPMPTFEFK